MLNNQDIIEFLALDIPEIDNPSDGFLEIICMEHNENINSRVYQYFLNLENNPSLAGVFISSLLSIIRSKIDKDLSIKDYVVNTEVRTTNNNRIDLYIDDEENKSAIIIENKLYHYLDNDLDDYWNYCKYESNKKIGVLLTLEDYDIPSELKGDFINITHSRWINKIKEIGLPTGLPNRLYIYANDFINTIDNLSNDLIMNKSTKFYYEHASKVNKAINARKEALNYVFSQVEIVASKLKLSVYGKKDDWRQLWDEDDYHNIYYTIVLRELFTDKKLIEIIIELEGDYDQVIPKFEKLLKDDESYQNLDKNGERTKTYAHFLKKSYDINLDNFENLADFIHGKIKGDFEPIMIKMVDDLEKTK